MNKIQFYPDDDLYEALDCMSKDAGISISVLVQDFLREKLCLEPRKNRSEIDLTKDVVKDVKNFIKNKNEGFEFDLMSASETFAGIMNLYDYESTYLKKKVGRNFAKQIKDGNNIANVDIATNRNGNTKRNQRNAIIYKVVKL